MTHRSLGSAIMALAGAVLLSGCAMAATPESENTMTAGELTLEQAKADAIATAQEMAAFFPAEFVTESRTTETSDALLPCSGDDRFGWPGRTTLIVSAVPDQAAALEPIAVEWESRGGWTVQRLITSKGNAAVQLDADSGTKVSVSFYKDASEVWVDVVSPCFHLPGGFVYGTDY